MYLSEIKKLDQEYIAHTYRRAELGALSGAGVICTDVGGKTYIDFSSGIGVNSLGFCPPAWAEAVKAQVDTLAHISNLYYTVPQVELAKALCERTGMERVFFANSGAEANEGAIKTARKYGSDHYGKDRCEIITLENSFHGRTIATLAATGQEVFHQNFGPFPAGFVFAQANDLADVEAKISERTCAIMIECIQGEGGVVPLDAAFIRGIAAICEEKDILLIIDEVQTGVGRTGKFVSYSHFGVKPDIVTLAKGLGGGLPIGAVLFGKKTVDTLGASDHGSTFGGNPVVCAGAQAILSAMDGKFMDSVTDKGNYLAGKLLEIDGVTGVTGKGLMLGASLEEGLLSADVAGACIQAGLIVLTAKAKVRLLPPLTITRKEIDAGLAILAAVLQELKEKRDETPAENA